MHSAFTVFRKSLSCNMKTVRIRIELNKGRVGMPLEKLATVMKNTVSFLNSVAVDLGIEDSSGAWLAEEFENNSVDFDCRLAVSLPEPKAIQLQTALRMVFANDYSDSMTAMLLQPITRRRYAQIAQALEPDESARFGLYNDGEKSSIDWFRLTTSEATIIDEPSVSEHKSFGEIQGIIHAFFKETDRPYLKIRELSTRQMVKCYFTPGLYQKAVEVMSDPDAVVFVQGWTEENADTGFITEIQVTDFRLAPEFHEDVYSAFIGSMPEFTGVMETTDYIRKQRDE